MFVGFLVGALEGAGFTGVLVGTIVGFNEGLLGTTDGLVVGVLVGDDFGGVVGALVGDDLEGL